MLRLFFVAIIADYTLLAKEWHELRPELGHMTLHDPFEALIYGSLYVAYVSNTYP